MELQGAATTQTPDRISIEQRVKKNTRKQLHCGKRNSPQHFPQCHAVYTG